MTESVHPAITERRLIIEEKRKLQSREMANTSAIENAVALGEIVLVDGKHEAAGVKMTSVTRTTYRYSPAVAALQEQEKFQGTADARTTTSYRFTLIED